MITNPEILKEGRIDFIPLRRLVTQSLLQNLYTHQIIDAEEYQFLCESVVDSTAEIQLQEMN